MQLATFFSFIAYYLSFQLRYMVRKYTEAPSVTTNNQEMTTTKNTKSVSTIQGQ